MLKPDIILLWIGAGIFAYLVYMGHRYRYTQLGIDFIFLMALACLWQISTSLGIIFSNLVLHKILIPIDILCRAGIPIVILFFAGRLTRRKWINNHGLKFMVCVLPVMTVILAATNDLHHWIYTGFKNRELFGGGILVPNYVSWFPIFDGYTYFIVLLSVIAFTAWYQKASPVTRKQAKILLFGIAPPVIANLLFGSHLIGYSIDPSPFALSLSGLVLVWGLYRYGWPDVIPIAREIVFESIREGVIVLDKRDHVLDINPTATNLFGGDTKPSFDI